MDKSNSTKEQTKPTPDLETLMHMGIFIPSDIKAEALTEKGKEVAGVNKEK